MITANMPQLVEAIKNFGDVHVHDTAEKTILQVSTANDMADVDDLICDALFVDPSKRVSTVYGWDIHLMKRERTRDAAADISVVPAGEHAMRYVLRAYA